MEPLNYMRLSVKKVAHNCSRPVLRRTKSGERQVFSWFSPKENHSSRSFSVHSNCETALKTWPNLDTGALSFISRVICLADTIELLE